MADDREVVATFEDRRWVFPRGDCVLLPVPNTTAEMLARYIGQQLLAAPAEPADIARPSGCASKSTNAKGSLAFMSGPAADWPTHCRRPFQQIAARFLLSASFAGEPGHIAVIARPTASSNSSSCSAS